MSGPLSSIISQFLQMMNDELGPGRVFNLHDTNQLKIHLKKNFIL